MIFLNFFYGAQRPNLTHSLNWRHHLQYISLIDAIHLKCLYPLALLEIMGKPKQFKVFKGIVIEKSEEMAFSSSI